MNVEPITRIALMVFTHDAVTGNFGKDGRRRNGAGKLVAMYHGTMRNRHGSAQVSVN